MKRAPSVQDYERMAEAARTSAALAIAEQARLGKQRAALLRAERQLLAERTRIVNERVASLARAAGSPTFALAVALLNGMPKDPEADEHRAALEAIAYPNQTRSTAA